jgi:hypothetical protein
LFLRVVGWRIVHDVSVLASVPSVALYASTNEMIRNKPLDVRAIRNRFRRHRDRAVRCNLDFWHEQAPPRLRAL